MCLRAPPRQSVPFLRNDGSTRAQIPATSVYQLQSQERVILSEASP